MFLFLIYLFTSVLTCFLSLWIVIPAPNQFLLFFSVGMPELSIWLIVIQALCLIFNFHWNYLGFDWLNHIVVLGNLMGLALSSLPLIQFRRVNQRFQVKMEQQLGQNYLEGIPSSLRSKMRSSPLVILDLFRGIPLTQVKIKRGIIFSHLGDINLTLNLYQPSSTGRHPTIVVIYGGAWQNGSPENNEQFSHYMAEQGYTVIAIDYRHAPEYLFPTQLEDIHLALKYIKENAVDLEINLEKMAIMGRSAGGHLALLAGYDNPWIKFQAVVDYYGPINLTHAYNHPPLPDPIDTRAVLENFLGGNPSQLRDLYHQASPINHVKPNLPATLLIYPRRDHIVQFSAGEKMAEQLLASDNCAVFLTIDWADHAFDTVFSGLSNQLALYYTERFLASIL